MTTPARRAAVLYNPVAGQGSAAALAEDAASRLREAGWQVDTLPTHAAGEAEPLARKHAPGIDRLVVAGGDGSVREAVSGLLQAGHGDRVEIAILPCGNANVVARELGVPLDPREALPCVTSSRVLPVDLGRANGDLFLAVVGVGWDARTVRKLDHVRRKRLGARAYRLWADLVYVFAGLASLFAPPGRFQLTADDDELPRGYCAVVVANLRTYGKGWSMTPDASATSGRLHYQARKRAGPLFMLWQLLAAMRRRKTPGFISDHGQGSRLRIEAEAPFAVQVDGDDRGDTQVLDLEVQPAGARFVAPEG